MSAANRVLSAVFNESTDEIDPLVVTATASAAGVSSTDAEGIWREVYDEASGKLRVVSV